MTDEITKPVLIDCTECSFSQVVDTDDKLPAEVLIEHGDKTGHRVVPKPLEK